MTASTAAEPVLALSRELMRERSVTPEDGRCQDIIAARLTPLGFACRQIDGGGVRNLWATRGTGRPLVVLAGHTDVVPPGPLDAWSSPPFEPVERDGLLYGRGAADMKSSLAAMVVAVERLLADDAAPAGQLAFLITSDEEGPATHGTRLVVDTLAAEGITPDYCIVGEPSSYARLGDVVRNGRRGSLNGTLTVIGTQGHVAYPEQTVNPIHAAAAALDELARTRWDDGNAYFPPTTFQISNVHAGTGATNVVPGELTALFNFRFSTEQTAAGLERRVTQLLDRHGLDYRLEWSLSGEPFLTEAGTLTDALLAAIRACAGVDAELSTSGGTSDGRFIAPWGADVVEFGPVNATIHKVDECVDPRDLPVLADIYLTTLRRLFADAA